MNTEKNYILQRIACEGSGKQFVGEERCYNEEKLAEIAEGERRFRLGILLATINVLAIIAISVAAYVLQPKINYFLSQHGINVRLVKP